MADESRLNLASILGTFDHRKLASTCRATLQIGEEDFRLDDDASSAVDANLAEALLSAELWGRMALSQDPGSY